MPTKRNYSGNQQNYVPAGNGDASGEYADYATGSNIHFVNFAQPLPSTFSTKKTTTKTKAPAQPKTPQPTPQDIQKAKEKAIQDTIDEINKKTVHAKDDAYKDFTSADLKGVLDTQKAKNYQIDKVLDKLGFNGLPQVVDKEVFDTAVKQSNFIAQRTMRGSNQAVADAFKQQLLSGAFYVNCSGGGAQYGQGMYCAADYNGQLTQGIKTEMAHYGGRTSATVTFTLTKDAKIVKYKDLINQFCDKVSTDKNALEFAAKTITQKALGKYYDRLADNVKARIKQDVEYYLTGDVKLQKSLNKQEAIDILNNSSDAQQVENYLKNNVKRSVSQAKNTQHDWYVKFACNSLGLNEGSLAACLGYDAINAEGHGQSGSYTVILNRTKCLFLKD